MHEGLSSGAVSSVAAGPDRVSDDARDGAHMTLDFALKIADAHAGVTDGVYEYEALTVLAAEVRRLQDRSGTIIDAQHDETGRMWRGPRGALPRGYSPVRTGAPRGD